MPRPTLAGLALVASILLGGCAAPPPADDAPIRVRTPIASDPMTTALLNTTDLYSNTIGLLVSDALVRLDEDLRYVPRVAASWTLSDDRRTIRFVLRDGVRWHDGSPVTADDVRFSVERLSDPRTGDRGGPSRFEGVDVRVVDARTVEATYAEPDADVLDDWTFPLIPEHLAAADEDLLAGAFARAPVGCGPFRFVRHDRGTSIVLAANDDHWAGRPAIDELVFDIVRDQRTALTALFAGSLDLMAMPPALYREARSMDGADRFRAVVYPRMSVWYLAYNVRRPALSDAGVRRALVHALDREAFAREILDGLAVPGATTWHPDGPWSDAAVVPLGHDPELARTLLADAGWSDTDGDGVLDRGGRPFRLRLLYARGSQAIVDQFAAWYQQVLAEVGVEVELDALEFQAMREQRDAGDFDVVLGSFGLDVNGDQSELYHSRSIEHGFNFFGWDDPVTDDLLDEARTTFDDERRRALYGRLQARLLEASPLVALFHLETPLLVRRELTGVRPTPLGLFKTVPGPAGWGWDATAGER